MKTKPTILITLLLTATLVPVIAQAYLSPYEVLLSPELVWPTTPRESETKVQWQQQESADRREREQAEFFGRQREDETHSAAASTADEDLETLVEELLDEIDYLEDNSLQLDDNTRVLLRAAERIREEQQADQRKREALSILESEGLIILRDEDLHAAALGIGGKGFAPLPGGKGLVVGGKGRSIIPLTETGPGTYLALMTLLVAGAWTIRRVKLADTYSK